MMALVLAEKEVVVELETSPVTFLIKTIYSLITQLINLLPDPELAASSHHRHILFDLVDL